MKVTDTEEPIHVLNSGRNKYLVLGGPSKSPYLDG